MREEISIARKERRQAVRKWRNTKLPIFKDMYRQAKHKVSKLVYTAKCKCYTEKIYLVTSSKELHQIVNTLSNGHPPRMLPTIYPSADLPSILIKHFTSKVEKLRASIASEHVTSTLVTGTTAASFSSPSSVTDMLHEMPLHNRNTRSFSYSMPLLNRPAHSKVTLGDRSFSFASSSVWNSIPNDVRYAPSLSSFKSRLKTFLFYSVYKD